MEEKIQVIEVTMKMCSKYLNLFDVTYEISDAFDNEFISSTSGNFNVVINRKWLEHATIEEVFISVCHECRHCYQLSQIIEYDILEKHGLFVENKKRRDTWYDEMKSYQYPDSKKYLYQDIEIDAIAFSALMCEEILKQKQEIPQMIKEQVLKRKRIILTNLRNLL